jgi:hypothetical protein
MPAISGPALAWGNSSAPASRHDPRKNFHGSAAFNHVSAWRNGSSLEAASRDDGADGIKPSMPTVDIRVGSLKAGDKSVAAVITRVLR